MLRIFSVLLVAIGVVVAICAAAKLPAAGQTYPETVPWSVLGVTIAGAGVAGWHVSVARDRAHFASSAVRDSADPFVVIGAIQEPIQRLNGESKSMKSDVLTTRIDALINEFIVPFSGRRNEVIARFGMRRGAEVLVDFAIGERMLNRAWSAAADGYAEEAIDSLDEAASAFSEVAKRVEEYGEGVLGG